MAILVSSIEAKNNTSFVTAVNALFGSLLSHNIRRVEFYPGQSLSKFGDDLKFDITYDTTGSVIATPFFLSLFTGNTLATAIAAAQAYIVANPTYFFSSIYCMISSPGTSRTNSNIVFLIANTVSASGTSNWAAGGAGASGVGTITGTVAANQWIRRIGGGRFLGPRAQDGWI